MYKLNRDDISNMLVHTQSECPELLDYILVNADGRCGKRVALAKSGDCGTFDVKTDYITYSEMNQFLRGYLFKHRHFI